MNRVSSPTQTKLKLKNQPLSPFVTLKIDLTEVSPRVGLRIKEKIKDATMKPTMNFGNRYQISIKLGFGPL